MIMKRFYCLVIPVLVLLTTSSCSRNNSKATADSTAKELAQEMADMKSTVVSYKTTMQSDGIKSVIISKQWIDLKNDRFATEMSTETDMMGTKTKQNTIIVSADGWECILNPADKTGIKTKSGSEDDENPLSQLKSDDDQTFRQMIEKEGGEILGNETFLGKNCIVVEMTIEDQSTKMWYYKGIPLKIANNNYSMEATSIEENVSIPGSRFEIPADYAISEMPDMP
jgi:hypothetical protein